MDPDAALVELRQMVSDSDPDNAARSRRYAELIGGLDDWLTKGEPLPEAWATVSRPSARVYWEGPSSPRTTPPLDNSF